MIQQIVITVVVGVLVILALKDSKKKTKISKTRVLGFTDKVSTCLTLFNQNQSLQNGFSLNVQIDYSLSEKKKILKEVNSLAPFVKLVDQIKDSTVRRNFKQVLTEAQKGESANLFKIKTLLFGVHQFLDKYAQRKYN